MGDSLTSHYELSLNSKGYVSSYGSNINPVYGNMGVATKYLPVSKTLKYNSRTEEVKYKWAFDADGYTTDVQIASTLGGTHYSFAWE